MSCPRIESKLIIICFFFYFLLIIHCFSGGIVTEGGLVNGAALFPAATMIHQTPYKIVCYSGKKDIKHDGLRNKKTKETDKSGIITGPSVRYINPDDYSGGCEEEGRHSIFFLFNMIPVSEPLNPDYAISMAVQRLEGDSMINARTWHEIHYFSFLGRAVVFKVRGDVIRFLSPTEIRRRKIKNKNGRNRK